MPGGPLPTDVDPPWDQVLVCAGQAAHSATACLEPRTPSPCPQPCRAPVRRFGHKSVLAGDLAQFGRPGALPGFRQATPPGVTPGDAI